MEWVVKVDAIPLIHFPKREDALILCSAKAGVIMEARPHFLVSVVIPTYNRRDTLQQCLASVTHQTYSNYEVIVVDDGSTDSTDEMIRWRFPDVRYIRQRTNHGPAAARNLGIEVARGEIVAFTDDDCQLPPEFLSRIVEGYYRYPEVAGVGGFLEAPEELLRSNPFARFEAYVTHQVYRAGLQEYLGGFECPAGGTNSMSYKKSVLVEVGGFDESFPYAAGEDADLKWRVVQRGYQLLYIPVKVTHLQSYTLKSFLKQQERHGRGVVHFERKWLGRLPPATRLYLRLLSRLARTIPRVLEQGIELSIVSLLAETSDWKGQWLETKRLRAAQSKQ